MPDRDRIMRDIDILRKSIKADWEKLSESDLSPEARALLRTYVEECLDKLNAVRVVLDDADA